MTIEQPEPSIPAKPTEPPEQPAVTVPQPTMRRTLATALIGALAGAAIVGTAWYATSSAESTDSKPAAAATANATSASSQKAATFTLTGTFLLTEGAVDDGALGCKGTGGYDDIGLGTSVTVYDAAGSVIATSSLFLSTFDASAWSCTFDVLVEKVPTGESFYQVEISHRGKLQLSAAQATSGQFSSSLG